MLYGDGAKFLLEIEDIHEVIFPKLKAIIHRRSTLLASIRKALDADSD